MKRYEFWYLEPVLKGNKVDFVERRERFEADDGKAAIRRREEFLTQTLELRGTRYKRIAVPYTFIELDFKHIPRDY